MSRNFRPGLVAAPAQDQRPAQPKRTGPGIIYTTIPEAKKDVRLYRRWADVNEWIRAAINHRKTQIANAPWDVVPIDPDGDYDAEMQLAIISLLSHPNSKTDSFRSMIEPVLEDMLVLDAGSIEVVRNLRGVPVQLWVVDGATIRVSRTWDGDPTDFRYFWYPLNRYGASLLDQDLIYVMANPSSHRVLGLSPLETLREAIDAEIAAARFNKGQVLQSPPQGIIDLGENASVENIDQFSRYWRAEIAGVKATAVVGGTKNMRFHPFGQSNKDMQFLQWQSYLIRKIAAVFQISPQDLGVLFDVNRANAQAQADLSEDRGIKPLIGLFESHLNREVVGEFQRTIAKEKHWRGEIDQATLRMSFALSYLDAREHPALFKQNAAANVLNLQFKFKVPSGRSGRVRADMHKIELSGIPYHAINEVREEELKNPVEGGDEIIVVTPLGPIRLTAITGQVPPSEVERAFLENAFHKEPLQLGNGEPVTALGDSDDEP